MSKAYDNEFFLLCDFINERLAVPVEMVQERIAVLGLRAARRILNDVGIISSSDGIEWSCLDHPLDLDDKWLEYRLTAAWYMINFTVEAIQHEADVRGL